MKKWISYIILCILIPCLMILGFTVFGEKQYAFVSLSIALTACVPFFIRFERQEQNTKRMIIIAVIAALSVVGRIVFASLPGFKPVTALVIVTAIYFGSEAGFMTGAVTAVISNFYFGQGPWTPFQMIIWGLIGFTAGLLAEPIKRSKVILVVYGLISGVVYSLLMDIWSVIWADGTFNFDRYLAMIATSGTATVTYAISNIIFLFIFLKPIGKILRRIKTKYGL